MTQAAINNAIVLYEMSIKRESVDAARKIYECEPILKTVLESPVVPLKEKHKIIERIFKADEFSKEMRNFLLLMSDYGQLDELEDIFQAFYKYWDEKNNILRAEIIFSKTPGENELKQAREFMATKYPNKQIFTEVKIDPDILGGLIIRVNYKEYNWSYEGRLKQLERKLTGR